MINNLYIKATPTTAAVTWGSITGTLSAQTDLQSALNAKQNTLTLTTTGTSGAATLVGSTLNIPQYGGGGGGSNPATIYINTTSGATVGTPLTNVISLSALIPANTLTSNSILQVIYKIKRITGNASIYAGHVFLNTSNTLTGATQIVSAPSLGATQSYAAITRTFQITGGNLCYLNTGTSQYTDYVPDVMLTTPFNVAVDNYLLFSIRTVGGGDTARTEAALLTKYF